MSERESGFCQVHNRQRNMAALMESGDVPGRFRCRPEFECNVGANSPPSNSQQAGGGGILGDSTICMLHGKRRSPHVLQQVQTPWGIQSHCKSDSRCKESRGQPAPFPFPMFGMGGYGYPPPVQFMHANLQTHAICHKHQKLRLMRYLDQQGNVVVCKEESQCLMPKGNGEGPAGGTAVCSFHGKLRRVEYLKHDEVSDTYSCLPEQQCKVGTGVDGDGPIQGSDIQITSGGSAH